MRKEKRGRKLIVIEGTSEEEDGDNLINCESSHLGGKQHK